MIEKVAMPKMIMLVGSIRQLQIVSVGFKLTFFFFKYKIITRNEFILHQLKFLRFLKLYYHLSLQFKCYTQKECNT